MTTRQIAWLMRQKAQADPPRRRGDLLKLPDTSITYAVRKAMEKTSDNPAGAKLAGVSDYVYVFVRKLIILSEDERLSPDRRTVLRGALRKIDLDKKVTAAKVLAEGIVNEFWTKWSVTGVSEEQKTSHRKRKKIFENVLFHIREACENNDEIGIPVLKQEERAQAIDTLMKSIENLSAMVRKINSPMAKKGTHDKGSGLQDTGHPSETSVGGVGKITTPLQ